MTLLPVRTRLWLDVFGHHPGLAIGPPQVPISLVVAGKALFVAIEHELPITEPIGNIRQVTQAGGNMTLLDIGIGMFSAMDAIDEILNVGCLHS